MGVVLIEGLKRRGRSLGLSVGSVGEVRPFLFHCLHDNHQRGSMQMIKDACEQPQSGSYLPR